MSKRGRKIPEVLSEEEQKKLLNVFNERYFSGQRNKTMIRLMLMSGLRLSETINLRWNDINFRTGKLLVREGKNRKDRNIWLGEKTLNVLGSWRERQSKKLEEKGVENDENLVFTTSTGSKLAAPNVRGMIYTYAEKAGIQEKVEKHYRDDEGNKLPETYMENKVSPHTLRHTFATDLYRETNDIRKVQKALGHSNLETTQIYTHIIDTELENSIKGLDDRY